MCSSDSTAAHVDQPHSLIPNLKVYIMSVPGKHSRLLLALHESHTLSLIVNDEWLEGHCAGSIGIFPSCFAYRENNPES